VLAKFVLWYFVFIHSCSRKKGFSRKYQEKKKGLAQFPEDVCKSKGKKKKKKNSSEGTI